MSALPGDPVAFLPSSPNEFTALPSRQERPLPIERIYAMMSISSPGLWRRLLSMTYESLILFAVLFIAGFIFHLVFRDTASPYFRPAFQLYLLVVAGGYFTWFWTHGGQTLPMQTWKLRVVSADGDPVSRKQAIARYLFAVIGIFLLGCGIFWALFDRERLFLHDRLAGTRVIRIEKREKMSRGSEEPENHGNERA